MFRISTLRATLFAITAFLGTVPCESGALAQVLDGDGDPLPQGAVVRLGTKRWRHPGEAHSLCWSRDGRMLAFVSNYGKTRIVDGDTGKLLLAGEPKREGGKILGHLGGIAFSPNGTELAVRLSGELVFVDVKTLQVQRSLPLATADDVFGNDPGNLHYSPDGKAIAYATGGNYAVLERATGDPIVKEETRAQIQGLKFTSDGRRLVVASLKPSVKVWDLKDRNVIARWTFSDDFFARGPAVSPDARHVAVGHRNVIVVDPAAGTEVATLGGDDPSDLFLELDYTPDGKLLIAASQEGPVYVWNTGDWSRRFKLTSDAWVIRSMAVRPDGKRVAVGDAGNRIWVWNLESGELLFNDRSAHDERVHAVAFSPDGALLASSSGRRDTHLWETRTWQHRLGNPASANAIAFNQDGSQLISSWYGSPLLRVRDVATGRIESEWPGGTLNIRTFRLSADASHLVLLRSQDEPRQWRVTRLRFPGWEPAGEEVSDSHHSGSLAVSPSGRFVATCVVQGAGPGSKYVIVLWDMTARRLLWTLDGHSHLAETLAISPDERFLVSGSFDKMIAVWELASGQRVHLLEGHLRSIAALAISPEGRLLASAGGAKGFPVEVDKPHQIRLWDLVTGQPAGALSGHDEDVVSLAFAPDGRTLAAGLRDTTVLVWQIPLMAAKHSWPKRELTEGDAQRLWDSLAAADAVQAHAAGVQLAGDPKRAIAIAKRHLQPAQVPDEGTVAALIKQLEDNAFARRQEALDKLAAMGGSIIPRLRAVVASDDAGGELKLRCGELLKRAENPFQPAGIGPSRAVQLLEWIGDEPARELLRALAAGAAEAHLTKEARAALKRLAE
jgi:WD40 repeat protein